MVPIQIEGHEVEVRHQDLSIVKKTPHRVGPT